MRSATTVAGMSLDRQCASGLMAIATAAKEIVVDHVAVAIGGTDYIVGGYNGTAGEPDVLATTDGQTFRTVATLPVPVRYPAIAALHGLLYVFGGEAVTGM